MLSLNVQRGDVADTKIQITVEREPSESSLCAQVAALTLAVDTGSKTPLLTAELVGRIAEYVDHVDGYSGLPCLVPLLEVLTDDASIKSQQEAIDQKPCNNINLLKNVLYKKFGCDALKDGDLVITGKAATALSQITSIGDWLIHYVHAELSATNKWEMIIDFIVKHCPNLREIEFGNCGGIDLTVTSLQSFASLKSLDRMRFNGCSITKEHAEAINQLKLKTCEIFRDPQLTIDAVAILLQGDGDVYLKDCSQITDSALAKLGKRIDIDGKVVSVKAGPPRYYGLNYCVEKCRALWSV